MRTSLPMSAARRVCNPDDLLPLHNNLSCIYMYMYLELFLQMLSSGSKHQGDGTDSESTLSAILECTLSAIEMFIAKKRKKKPSATSGSPLEVVHQHPVLVSTLALVLHQRPELVSARCVLECSCNHGVLTNVYLSIRHVDIVTVLCSATEECPAFLVNNSRAQFELVSPGSIVRTTCRPTYIQLYMYSMCYIVHVTSMCTRTLYMYYAHTVLWYDGPS